MNLLQDLLYIKEFLEKLIILEISSFYRENVWNFVDATFYEILIVI